MQKITPFLWFNDTAEAAVNFYTSLFKNSAITQTSRYDKAGAEVSGRAEGSVMVMGFQLCGQDFSALNGGPMFSFSPAISFSVDCETEEEIDHLWHTLSKGGVVRMPFEKYPFSEKYGWVDDKYGVSWQLNLTRTSQKITPSFLFVGEVYGRAEEAMQYYITTFHTGKVNSTVYYPEGSGEKEKAVMYANFSLFDQSFIAMDSGAEHAFSFTPALSFVVNCESQEEIDEYWNALTSVAEAEQCGWLKDKFGVSWQIVPTVLGELLSNPDPVKAGKVMEAMLKMKKFDIDTLQKAMELPEIS